jgi:hypothetical protein
MHGDITCARQTEAGEDEDVEVQASDAGEEAPTATATAEGSDDYAVVDGDAAVDAMAACIAEYLRTCPEASKMDARQLSECLAATIKDMKSRTTWRAWMRTARRAYRWGALGYSAFQVYSNPWIYRAIATSAALAMRNRW